MAKLGKRAGLKHPWASALEGSIPSPGTSVMSRDIVHTCPATSFHVQPIGW